MLTDFVIPYLQNGVISAKWGKKVQSYQVNKLRVYRTSEPWYKKSGILLEDFLKRSSGGARSPRPPLTPPDVR
jgi:hypothetical protein